MQPILIQAALKEAGLYTGELDGIFGPRSRAAADAALAAAKVNVAGWPHSRRMVAVRQWVLQRAGLYTGAIDGLEGPLTRAAEYAFTKPAGIDLPWIAEAEKVIDLHEKWDGDRLDAWLKSDGNSVGDAAAVPWCGDFVETAIRRALPDEKIPANPFGARNWSKWGEAAPDRYGAIISFWRGRREGWQGHVGFAVAVDRAARLVQVLGGNQGNEVSRAWLGLDRVLGWRAPMGWAEKMPPVPDLSSSGAPVSTNEA